MMKGMFCKTSIPFFLFFFGLAYPECSRMLLTQYNFYAKVYREMTMVISRFFFTLAFLSIWRVASVGRDLAKRLYQIRPRQFAKGFNKGAVHEIYHYGIAILGCCAGRHLADRGRSFPGTRRILGEYMHGQFKNLLRKFRQPDPGRKVDENNR